MDSVKKEKKWLKPMFEFDESPAPKKLKKEKSKDTSRSSRKTTVKSSADTFNIPGDFNQKHVMKSFDPTSVEELAVNIKKVQEVDSWIKSECDGNCNSILLLTGPVGCGKTTTVMMLAARHGIKITEWITPVDIDLTSDYGELEFREKQSKKFLDFIIKAANFTSLLDNNKKKIVLVEDFPNTFTRTPSEFTEVMQQYQIRAKSPIIFICSDSNSDNKDTAANLFNASFKEQFKINHINFNSVAVTGLKSALKRVSEIMNKKYSTIYNVPAVEMIDCVVNSSGGDVRSAVTNLHFACLKGSTFSLETSLVVEKENKSKATKMKKQGSSKFLSIGKDQTVSILHGVGRVLNPKFIEGTQKFTHSPSDIIEQFMSQPSSFINFMEENFLPHFSSIEDVVKAASALSDADFMLAEWRDKMCQEYGLYVAVAGMMTANKAPVSAWNPVRGPKNMKIKYPSPSEIPLIEENFLYKGKTLVSDYQTYCKIIAGTT